MSRTAPPRLTRLAALALQIAAAPPERQDGRAYVAQVPWRLVHELREQLEALGIDWRDFKRQTEGPGADP